MTTTLGEEHPIPVGTSEPQDFEVLDRNEPVNGTGWTVTLEVARADGGTIVTPPAATVLTANPLRVRVTGTEALALGRHYARFKLTDGGGGVGYAPNRVFPMVWRVVPITDVPPKLG